jgi:hypothetical protein
MNQFDESFKDLSGFRDDLMSALIIKYKNEEFLRSVKKPIRQLEFDFYDEKIQVRSYINPIGNVGYINTYSVEFSETQHKKMELKRIEPLNILIDVDFKEGMYCKFNESGTSFLPSQLEEFLDEYENQFLETLG